MAGSWAYKQRVTARRCWHLHGVSSCINSAAVAERGEERLLAVMMEEASKAVVWSVTSVCVYGAT